MVLMQRIRSIVTGAVGFSITLCLALLLTASVHADDWPQFRGPTGLGQTPQKIYPYLQQVLQVVNNIHEEATCDELFARIEKRRGETDWVQCSLVVPGLNDLIHCDT